METEAAWRCLVTVVCLVTSHQSDPLVLGRKAQSVSDVIIMKHRFIVIVDTSVAS